MVEQIIESVRNDSDVGQSLAVAPTDGFGLLGLTLLNTPHSGQPQEVAYRWALNCQVDIVKYTSVRGNRKGLPLPWVLNCRDWFCKIHLCSGQPWGCPHRGFWIVGIDFAKYTYVQKGQPWGLPYCGFVGSFEISLFILNPTNLTFRL